MKPSWIACWVTEKAPEMTAAGDDRRRGREEHERQAQRFGGQEEERILTVSSPCGLVLRQEHCPLSHIVEHQGRHDEVARKADRLAAEMAHVGNASAPVTASTTEPMATKRGRGSLREKVMRSGGWSRRSPAE